jgi:uncharacterized protein with HEPN domain
MNGKVRRTQEYLRHMVEAARRIAAYVDGLDQSDFAADTKTQDAVIRNLEIIGEAARNVLNTIRTSLPRMPGFPGPLPTACGTR